MVEATAAAVPRLQKPLPRAEARQQDHAMLGLLPVDPVHQSQKIRREEVRRMAEADLLVNTQVPLSIINRVKAHIPFPGNVCPSWHMNCAFLLKVFLMGKDHRGQPAGSNKREDSGIKPVMSSENLEGSEKMRKKYTKDEDRLADNIKGKHPNRNRNKGNSTNIGGYRH